MIARRRNRKSLAALALGLAVAFAPAGATRAQHQSVDPYDPYGAPYRAFAFPVYRATPNMYGREGAPGGRAANLLDDYYFGDSDLGFGPSRTSSAGAPYYRAYRLLDEDFGRVSRPNEGLDDEFDRSMRARDRAYAEAMREPDPNKRAQKMRAVDRMDIRASRDLSPNAREAAPKARRRPASRPADSEVPESRRSAGASLLPDSRLPSRRERSNATPEATDLRRRPSFNRLSPPSVSDRLRARREAARAGSANPIAPDLPVPEPPPADEPPRD